MSVTLVKQQTAPIFSMLKEPLTAVVPFTPEVDKSFDLVKGKQCWACYESIDKPKWVCEGCGHVYCRNRACDLWCYSLAICAACDTECVADAIEPFALIHCEYGPSIVKCNKCKKRTFGMPFSAERPVCPHCSYLDSHTVTPAT